MADQLANMGESIRGQIIIADTSSLPDTVQSLLKLDQDGSPNFRFKPMKNHFVINDANST